MNPGSLKVSKPTNTAPLYTARDEGAQRPRSERQGEKNHEAMNFTEGKSVGSATLTQGAPRSLEWAYACFLPSTKSMMSAGVENPLKPI